jgi:hypothetical protein
MSPEIAYFIFGLTLTVTLAAIAIFYFSRKRKQTKGDQYRMWG